MFYRNISNYTKVFYGITFKPGHIEEVPGYINDSDFVKVTEKDYKDQSSTKKSEIKSDSTKAASKTETKSAE